MIGPIGNRTCRRCSASAIPAPWRATAAASCARSASTASLASATSAPSAATRARTPSYTAAGSAPSSACTPRDVAVTSGEQHYTALIILPTLASACEGSTRIVRRHVE